MSLESEGPRSKVQAACHHEVEVHSSAEHWHTVIEDQHVVVGLALCEVVELS
jgi:hypothetical protein